MGSVFIFKEWTMNNSFLLIIAPIHWNLPTIICQSQCVIKLDPIQIEFAIRLQTPHCNVIEKFKSKRLPLKIIWCKYFHLSVYYWTVLFFSFYCIVRFISFVRENRVSLASHRILNRYSFNCSIRWHITLITFHSLFHSFRFLIDDQVLKMVSNLWIHFI